MNKTILALVAALTMNTTATAETPALTEELVEGIAMMQWLYVNCPQGTLSEHHQNLFMYGLTVAPEEAIESAYVAVEAEMGALPKSFLCATMKKNFGE